MIWDSSASSEPEPEPEPSEEPVGPVYSFNCCEEVLAADRFQRLF